MASIVDLIRQGSRARQLDPRAVLAVAGQEGLGGGIGDNNTSFGPFQLHYGGAYPSHAPRGSAAASQAWAQSPAGINYALDQIAGVACGMSGREAVYNIVHRFERPADPTGEAARAWASYGGQPTSVQATPPAASGVGAAALPQALPNAMPSMKIPGLNQPGYNDLLQPLVQGGGTKALMNSLFKQSDLAVSNVPKFLQPKTLPLPNSDLSVPATPSSQPPAPPSTPGLPATAGTANVVAAAQKWLGTPYSWGGGGPGGPSTGFAQGANIKGFDCSSLLQYAYSQQGVAIPRVTYDQFKMGQRVPAESLRPGDAVFFNMGSRGPEHVGIYMGGGKFIEAPHTGAEVRISDLSSRSDFVGARRYG